MAVVVDEMEVSPSERGTKHGSDGGKAGADQQGKPQDYEVERMMQRQVERAERVWAH